MDNFKDKYNAMLHGDNENANIIVRAVLLVAGMLATVACISLIPICIIWTLGALFSLFDCVMQDSETKNSDAQENKEAQD